MQLSMPLSIGIAFYRQGNKFAAAVMLLWLGENGFGISNYMKDARAQNLPLVGGEIHDWNYLLGKLGWLSYDQILGNIVWSAGCVTVIAAVVSGFVFAEKDTRAPS